MTLSQALLPTRSLAVQALLALAGSALIAVAAKISVPMFPVPMTLQTLAVMLVGMTLGARAGAVATALYVAEAAAGLPVLAPGSVFGGPTLGFVLGFVPMAAVAGLAADLGARRFVPALMGAVAASLVLYVPGVLWLDAATGLNMTGAIEKGMLPFLAGDMVKSVIAAMLISGAWKALRR
ncbi:biotin transporter BioY [Phaeovulum vinaykumarii]|uniref:Biotin transporter n=1 Tax=Phaeovulum vinaykumarii TaxID=407234 RepID=A0A1N7M3U5_9RHOB|nr:biotin transporter BioY [Phaeovulum vinaykumarii]SIS80758.1 biotin transport system substrate-specific component [Phaeovulum vinaykumarii]SOC08972.1 biotin transport system substrate-specific component [Phaeovulum vinaykumarii]